MPFQDKYEISERENVIKNLPLKSPLQENQHPKTNLFRDKDIGSIIIYLSMIQ